MNVFIINNLGTRTTSRFCLMVNLENISTFVFTADWEYLFPNTQFELETSHEGHPTAKFLFNRFGKKCKSNYHG